MKILVVGSGGREHALCWKIAQSPQCQHLYCAPGNPGIGELAKLVPIAAEKVDEIAAFAQSESIDFVMIGPEVPLSLGLADRLRDKGILVFGPSQSAARLESSKGFMKDLCSQAGVPTAAYARFKTPDEAKAYVQQMGAPIVVKADGLAAGKGVTIAQTLDEAYTAIDDAMVNGIFGASGAEVVIEEFMQGEEASFFAICDGETAIPFAAAQDHKAAFDGDKGPNTGGMGAYSPAPIFDAAMQDRVMRDIVLPTVKAMKAAGCPFTGVLFAGLMITKTGPRLIEFNARFGDPETQAMLPRLKTDLLSVLIAAAKGELNEIELDWHDRAALCVVMASNGYPGTYQKGSVIRGLNRAAQTPDAIVFHAGTALNADGDITSHGGRVLGVTAWADTIKQAQTRAYQALDQIDWPEGFARRDIAWRAIKD